MGGSIISNCKKASKIISKTWKTGEIWSDVATDLMAANLTFI